MRRHTAQLLISIPLFLVMLACPAVEAASDMIPTAHEVEDLVRLARKGSAQAQFRLAQAYETGKGTRQSFSEAVRWYTAAANQGVPHAQFNLAAIYEEGRPEVKRDLPSAISWYEEAARNGLQSAVERIANLTSKSSNR